MTELGVYVPVEGTITTIKPGSAICGTEDTVTEPGGPGNGQVEAIRLMLYYEGNVYGWDSMSDWETQLFHAADRLMARYPTVARCWVQSEGWQQVAWYDYDRKSLDVDEPELLKAWIERGEFVPSAHKADLVDLWRETRGC